MGLGTIIGACIVGAILIVYGVEFYDFIQVKRGVFPKKSETTLDDIKTMRDNGHNAIALRRFMELPENKGKFTDSTAKRKISEL